MPVVIALHPNAFKVLFLKNNECVSDESNFPMVGVGE